MRVIFLLLLSSIAFQSNSQTWNNYLQKRFKSYGIWADSILLVPNDTSLNKTGFAIKGSTAYIGDGVKWTAITGGSSVVDSLVYATKANVIKVRDSLLAADNFWSGVNTFLNTLNVSNDLQLGAANASYGNAIFYNANNSNKVQIFSSDTLATDVDIELPTSSGKLALTTDIAIVDTSIISTKAYVNYKDDIQQTFIDYRKLDDDSSGWTGYTSRARTQQIVDSMKAKDLIRDDTLSVHNTRTLANQNAINSLDALVVKLGGAQTITGVKTFNAGTLKIRGYDAANTAVLKYAEGADEGTITFPTAGGGKSVAYQDWVTSRNYIPQTRTLTIGQGGSATDLSADRTFLSNVPNVDATNASNITSGTLSDARLSSNVPKMVSNVLPAVDGSLLTNLNPASIATVIQTITATATINNSTTTLLVNPATVVSSLSITFCAAPYQTQIIRIVFGGTITSGNQVVTTLSILPNSGQSVVRVFPSVEAFAGDFLAFQYINTNWYQIN